jgi:hypothetical protein
MAAAAQRNKISELSVQMIATRLGFNTIAEENGSEVARARKEATLQTLDDLGFSDSVRNRILDRAEELANQGVQ